MAWYVYILEGPGKRYYIGSTQSLAERVSRHNQGSGAIYTGRYRQFHLAYSESHPLLAVARNRERQLKGWTRAKKEALMSGDTELLKRL